MEPPLALLLFGALLAPSAARAPATNASAAPTVQVTVGVLLPERNLNYPWAWPRVAPALSLALEALQPQLSRAGLAVSTVFASTENEKGACDHGVAHAKAAQLKSSRDLDVLLGLGCIYRRGGMAAPAVHHWQLPLLRAGEYLRDGPSSTTVYVGPAGPDLGAFQAQLHRHFNWTSRAVLVFSYDTVCGQQSTAFFRGSEDHRAGAPNITAPLLYLFPDHVVKDLPSYGRVVYICGPLETFQEFMQLAQARNMTNGDYVFFYVDIFGKTLRAEGHREAAKPWKKSQDKAAKPWKKRQDKGSLHEAFQSVLVITPHEPQTPEYRRFQSQLIQRAQRDFGVAINDSRWHLVAGCFHDGLLLYLRALNETLREGGTKRDTSRILEKMRGQKFQGVTGSVSINRKNDREMDFDLWAMKDVGSGEFHVVAHYIASEKQIKWLGPIHWKKGGPPLDNPPGVFDLEDPSCGKSGCARK